MKETQLLKGVLDGCVLHIIANYKIYGYELVQKLKQYGFDTIVGGTVYPLLQKLEKMNLIEGRTEKSLDGPDRKYLYITSEGKAYLAQFDAQWLVLVGKVAKIIETEEGESYEN
ncbi:PadR family transcriptional regulator [Pseudolactococcus yaeyamensis]